jgi:hypothetical protein
MIAKVIETYVSRYGKVFSLLLLLAYAYLLFFTGLILFTSDISPFLVIPSLFAVAVILQMLCQKDWLNNGLAIVCSMLSVWVLFGSLEVYQKWDGDPLKQAKVLRQILPYTIPFCLASLIIVVTSFFRIFSEED